MARKHIVIEEVTRILFNKVRAKIIKADPKRKRLTDNLTVNLLCKKYMGG